MTRDDAIYMAGLFDGEGCIDFIKRYTKYSVSYCVRICIKMNNKETIEFIRDITCVGTYEKCKIYKNYRQSYRWYAGGKNAVLVLQQILPFLKCKKLEALLAIDFQRKFPQKQGKVVPDYINLQREAYYRTMKRLKRI